MRKREIEDETKVTVTDVQATYRPIIRGCSNCMHAMQLSHIPTACGHTHTQQLAGDADDLQYLLFLLPACTPNTSIIGCVSLNTADCGSNNVVRCNSLMIKFRPNKSNI